MKGLAFAVSQHTPLPFLPPSQSLYPQTLLPTLPCPSLYPVPCLLPPLPSHPSPSSSVNPSPPTAQTDTVIRLPLPHWETLKVPHYHLLRGIRPRNGPFPSKKKILKKQGGGGEGIEPPNRCTPLQGGPPSEPH
jgi:hypothetical protein